jgi:hypothetical protein
MPALDWLCGTLDERAWSLQRAAYDGAPGGGALGTPGFVFLVHVVDIMSSMHVPFTLRSLGARPFTNHFFLLPFWPLAFFFMLLMWCCSKTFVVSFYCLRGQLHQTWSVPRYGFQVRTTVIELALLIDGAGLYVRRWLLHSDVTGIEWCRRDVM